ncbi:MAG: putative glycosyltransferase EpsJ [Syntrophorhabdus sp. PtaU1.Bin153]|nr:MAG: putative glycosyltransferase EpsJ [Syntrophorhabdus sp. PtaU1.Bin153]
MVSVVITTFNRRSFLREAVLSVLAQDYRDKEIIVVDDGSMDNSYEEVRGLNVRYIWQRNGGISSARNTGIAVSKGDYLAFLDVDDLWKKRKLSEQMGRMTEGASPVSYTDEIWIRNGKWLNQRQRHKKYSGYIFEQCLPLCIISPSSVVVKREIFDDVGLFDESLPVCEDYDMWLRIASKYPVLFVDKP